MGDERQLRIKLREVCRKPTNCLEFAGRIYAVEVEGDPSELGL